MQTLFFAVFVLVSVSCKTVVTESTTSSFEPHVMVRYDDVSPIWINKFVVVGVMTEMEGTHELLDDLNLEQDTEVSWRSQIRSGPMSTMGYSFFRRKDGEAIETGYSKELDALRSANKNNFGLGVFNEEGQISAILTNYISVDIKRFTSDERIDSLLSADNPLRYFRWRDNTYYVEYDMEIGYDILDIAKHIHEDEAVEGVEHVTRTIKGHSR